jgi:hypothetical protein
MVGFAPICKFPKPSSSTSIHFSLSKNPTSVVDPDPHRVNIDFGRLGLDPYPGGQKWPCIKGTDEQDRSGQKLGSFDRSSLKREARKVFRKIRPSTILWEPIIVSDRLLVLELTIIVAHFWIYLLENEEIEAFWWHHCAMVNAGKIVYAQYTNALSILRGFYKLKTMDDDQKKFIPPLAIDTEFFHCLFANACTI